MRDAPERIWAVPEYNCTVYMSGNSPITAQTGPFEHRLHGQAAAYVRADLSDALLREAMEVLERCPPTSNPTLSAEYHLERINAWWRLDVRPALAKIKGADHD